MKKSFLLLSVFLPLNFIVAQPRAANYGVAEELSTVISGGKSQLVRTFDNRFNDDTKGSPFLIDEWLPGTLMLFDSSTTGDSLRFKFDTYLNEVWVIKIQYDSVILYSTYIRELDLRHPDGRHWQFKKYAIDNSSSPIKFYQSVFDGPTYTLVKDERKLLVKANFVERGVYSTGLPYDRFDGSATDYYLRFGPDKPFGKIPLKRNTLLELAPPDKAKALEAFCKKERIGKNLSDEEAVQMVRFLDP